MTISPLDCAAYSFACSAVEPVTPEAALSVEAVEAAAVEAVDPVAAAEAVCTPVSPAEAVSPDAPFIASAAVSAAAARAVSACAAPPAFSVLFAVSAVSSLFGGLPPAALPDSAAGLLPHPASITASIITSKKHNRVSVLILHIKLLYLQRQLFLSIQWTPEITL